MSISTITPSTVSASSSFPGFQNPHQYGKNGLAAGGRSSVNASMVSEYYSSQSLSFEYTSKDGDTVSFSMESMEYSKSIMEVSAQGNAEDMKELVDFIKDNFAQMRKDMIRGFLKSIGEEIPEDKTAEEVGSIEPYQVPEEWNAENTSQRIVDFAVSFAGIFEGSNEEFLNTIKAAVEDGFKQARDILGQLPDQISGLIDDTYELVMQKLDAWANEQDTVVQEAAETSV